MAHADKRLRSSSSSDAETKKLDTDHGFYLLDGQVVDDGRAPLLQGAALRQQRRDGYFGCDADVAQWQCRVRGAPLGDVEQPLGGGAVFE